MMKLKEDIELLTDPKEEDSAQSPQPPTPVPLSHEVDFIVTGFGPFGDVKLNPTMMFIQKLHSYLPSSCSLLSASRSAKERGLQRQMEEQEHDKDHLRGSMDDIALLLKQIQDNIPSSFECKSTIHARICETSTQNVDDQLRDIHDDIADIAKSKHDHPCHEHHIILLHLGVDAKSTHYKLESQALNNASFRIPDVQGYQPMNTCIDSTKTLEDSIQTDLDLKRIREMMLRKQNELKGSGRKEMNEEDITISTDCGRYVCNYTYYRSLDLLQRKAMKDETDSQNKEVPVMKTDGKVTNIDQESSFLPSNVKMHTLFLHVPKLGPQGGSEDQFYFVLELMNCIRISLCAYG